MAKSKLTKQAIRFFVDTYDDETTNHTFHQVRKMIEDKFKITVTYEAIRKVIMLIKTLYQLKIVKTIKLMMGMELILLSTLKQKTICINVRT